MAQQQQQEEFLLKWNDHHASFFNIVEDLCRTEQLCDVTLACGGQVFETHRLILSVCSPYFRTMLNRVDKHPIIYLKDVNPQHLEQLLSYMYRGEINVLQDDLGPLIETARGLQIKGLADAGGSDKKEQTHNQKSVLKRPKTTTPTPSLPKLPKVDKPKKTLVCSNLVSGEVSSAPSAAAAAALVASSPLAADKGEEAGVVKLENEEGWTEDNSIPNEAYEVNLSKNYEQELVKSYEADLQMEDEQYIQPDGLTGQQVPLPASVSLPPSLSLTPRGGQTSPPVSPPPAPALFLQPWCAIKQDNQIFTCTYCNRNFDKAKELHIHVKTQHNSHTQIESSLSSLERLSCLGVSVALTGSSRLPPARPVTSNRLSGSPGVQQQPRSPGYAAMGRKQFYEHSKQNQSYQSPLMTNPLKYKMAGPDVKSLAGNMSAVSSFQRQRPAEKSSGMDSVQDTLNQLSRLAGGGQQPNQTTNLLQSADSNQPIVHHDESSQPMGSRDTQSADEGRKSDDSSAQSNESKETEALSEGSREDGGHVANVKTEITDEAPMSDS